MAERDRQAATLDAYARSGSVANACDVVGIPRSVFYGWVKTDNAFANRYDQITSELTDALIARLLDR